MVKSNAEVEGLRGCTDHTSERVASMGARVNVISNYSGSYPTVLR